MRFDRTRDPLYRDVRLRHVIERSILGVPVRFESNAAAAVALVKRAYAPASRPARRAGAGSRLHARVRLIVHDAVVPERMPPRIVTRLPQNDRLLLQTTASMALADTAGADGVIYATPALLSASDVFVSGMLDATVLAIVTQRDRVPIHAAAVRGDRGVLLLAGPSGSGKSTLAYAALQAGLAVLSDDTAYVQLRPALTIWSATRALRVPLAARAWFPALRRLRARRGADGESKLLMPVRAVSDREAHRAGAVAVCLLDRRRGRVRVSRLSRSAVERALSRSLEPGFDRFASRMGRVVTALSAPGGWRLAVSRDPRDALPHIQRILAELDAAP